MGHREAHMITHAVPGAVNGLINAYAWVDPHIATYGPGVAIAAVFALAWRALNRASRYIERMRYRTALGHQLADERREMTELSAALDQAPLTPTQHGHDQHALDTRQAIRDADSREETP
jgi:hypothetical protein